MKAFLSIVFKSLLKICSAAAFMIIAVFGFVICPFTKLARLAALPLTVICGAAAFMEFHAAGLSMEVVLYGVLAIVLTVAYFMLPYLANGIAFVKSVLRDVMCMQIIVRSPVKYTI